MFSQGVLWDRRLVLYRKCVFCLHKEVAAARVVMNYEWDAALLVGIRA